MKKIIAVIPARYQSSRFPGKPLAPICGKPMIQWVYESVSKVKELDAVYIATDDDRIYQAVQAFGGKAVMTGDCSCGTDRVYQASKDIDCDVILNIQGDEPLIKEEMIKDLISAFSDESVVMATLKKKIENPAEIDDPNVVKVITDCNGDAIYFSRYAIPYNRDGKDGVSYYRHIGAYGYTKEFLEKYVKLPASSLENIEKLEQLRVLENGCHIRVKDTVYQSIGVDLPEHIALVEEEIRRNQ